MEIPFLKMEGAGNDYIYIDCFDEKVHDCIEKTIQLQPRFIQRLSNRHYGIGSDGLVLLLPSDRADVEMKMFNSDGSYSEMCGNALRCVSWLMHRKNGNHSGIILTGNLECPFEIQSADSYNGQISVEMGMPQPGAMLGFEIDALPRKAMTVSMGNPHCVFFVEDPDLISLEKIGPVIEHDSRFENRTNVEIVKQDSHSNEHSAFYQRTWERGTGETLACGSGACAVHVAAHVQGLTGDSSTIRLKGGELKIRWSSHENNPLIMTGPVRFVYEGLFNLNSFLDQT